MADRDPRAGWWMAAAGVLASAALVRAAWPAAQRTATVTGRGAHGVPPDHAALASGFETKDAEPRWIVWIIAGGVSVVFGVVLGLRTLQTSFEARRVQDSHAFTVQETTRIAPPPPNLQADPLRDLASLRMEEDRLLGTYGWLDTAHGLARIPIGRAMTLTVGKTLDAVP